MNKVITPRGCPYDIYMYELMKEFNNNKQKYEPLNGYFVYVRRENGIGSIIVHKSYVEHNDILNDHSNGPVYHQYFPFNDDIEEHIKQDKRMLCDNSIKVEYNGTNIDLGIEPGESAIVCRNDNNQLYVLFKWTRFNKQSFDYLHNLKERFAICENHLLTTINSKGLVEIPKKETTYEWM